MGKDKNRTDTAGYHRQGWATSQTILYPGLTPLTCEI